jgi:hypothetical protein
MKTKLWILIVVLSGCGILNRSTRNTATEKQQMEAKLKERKTAELLQHNNFEQLVLSHDSLQATYHLRIYPKGAINFAVDGSFSGQFDSIMMNGQQSKLFNAEQKTQASALNKVTSTNELEADLTAGSSNKKTTRETRSDLTMVLTLVLILGILIFFLSKRFLYPSK